MNILVVEDDKMILRVLKKHLKEWGYGTLTATNGAEAWEIMKTIPESIEVVLTDWVMPEMNGLELCERIRKTRYDHYVYLILISTRDSESSIVRGLEGGVDDYIVKPLNPDELHARLEIADRIIRLEKDLREKYEEMKRNHFQTIQMFTNLIEVYDKNLGGHCRRVAKVATALAKRHPLVSDKALELVETAGLLHDIGMVGLPKEIFTKKRTEMNSEDKQFYLTHPVQGEIVLKEIGSLRPAARLIRAHHEQVNGLGFPDGLEERRIPLLAKIISGASMYDNLVHRGGVPMENIPEHLIRFKGYQLDPTIVDLLLEVNLDLMQQEHKKEYQEVQIDDLKQGMALAKNVRMKSGVLVLPAESELTEGSIDKLKNYLKLACITDKVYIKKQGVRG
ncbi:MAG: response regulator [Desulfobacterales bacterium]|nr:response regulator [Desulfobacterales bacterium]